LSRGRLIALEGGEGTGKSTQIQYLAAFLTGIGTPPLMTREPGGTPGGQALRRLLLSGAGISWTPEAETLLMIADRAQHVAELIAPALAAGQTVLTDRYVASTLAYQGAGRGVDRHLIRDLHRATCRDLWPDLTILLDLDPRIGLARSVKRLTQESTDEARFEMLDLAFHDRVRAAFLAFAADHTDTVAIIDATGDIDTVRLGVEAAVSRHWRESGMGVV
jgi:dTMP kinase